MKRSMQIGFGFVLAVGLVCALKVWAETEPINPTEVVTRAIRLTGTTPLTINGTAVTATAAQLNSAAGGSTAALTPTTIAATSTLSVKGASTLNTLSVTGATATVSGTLAVTGKTTLTGGLAEAGGWIVTNSFAAGVYTQRLFYAVGNVVTNVTITP